MNKNSNYKNNVILFQPRLMETIQKGQLPDIIQIVFEKIIELHSVDDFRVGLVKTSVDTVMDYCERNRLGRAWVQLKPIAQNKILPDHIQKIFIRIIELHNMVGVFGTSIVLERVDKLLETVRKERLMRSKAYAREKTNN